MIGLPLKGLGEFYKQGCPYMTYLKRHCILPVNGKAPTVKDSCQIKCHRNSYTWSPAEAPSRTGAALTPCRPLSHTFSLTSRELGKE